MTQAVSILLIIWCSLEIINCILQVTRLIKQYRECKRLEESIKNFDNVMGETQKGLTRDKFFEEIEELKRENEEKDEKEKK